MKPEDLEPFDRWQLEKFGNVLPPVNTPVTSEDSTEEERRFSEWMQHEAEQQMAQMEENFQSIKD